MAYITLTVSGIISGLQSRDRKTDVSPSKTEVRRPSLEVEVVGALDMSGYLASRDKLTPLVQPKLL